ncbi:hypothetical protein RM96_25590 [Cupriavidus sp. IDO]|nr:hypothetical protein RM96_25590 [Cupriavidus sp. IDO]
MDPLQARSWAVAVFAALAALAAGIGNANATTNRQPVTNSASVSVPSVVELAVSRPKDCDPHCGGERQPESNGVA